MAIFFFDTSALVKRYVTETGSGWVRSITDPAAGHVIFVVNITAAEAVAAIKKKERDNKVSAADASSAIAYFKADLSDQYNAIQVTDEIISEATWLIENYPLRGYDAVQLAGALEINRRSADMGLAATGAPPVTFVCADGNLNRAATAAGLVVEKPDHH